MYFLYHVLLVFIVKYELIITLQGHFTQSQGVQLCSFN